jgi:hypothetical protein
VARETGQQARLQRQDRPVSGYGSIAALIRLGTLPGAAALGLLTLLLTSP